MKKWSEMTKEEHHKIRQAMRRGLLIERSYFGVEWSTTETIGQPNLYYRARDRIVEELVTADAFIIGTITMKNGKIVPGSLKLKECYE